MVFFLVILTLFAASINPNDELANNLLKQLDVENCGYHEDFFSVKGNKNQTEYSICILPVITSIEHYKNYEIHTMNLYLIEFNNNTQKIIRSKKISQDIQEDPTGPRYIELDLSYRLSTNVWATGVTIGWYTRSWENWGKEQLMIFKSKNTTFQEVFSTTTSTFNSYRGMNCESSRRWEKDTLKIDSSYLVNGYYPIDITSSYGRTIINRECQDTTIQGVIELSYVMQDSQYIKVHEIEITPLPEVWWSEKDDFWFDWKNKN